MDSQTRRTIIATLLCLLILLGWFKYQEYTNPNEPTTSAPADVEAGDTALAAGEEKASEEAEPPAVTQEEGGEKRDAQLTAAPDDKAPPKPVEEYTVADAPAIVDWPLGNDSGDPQNPYEFGAVVTSRGAALQTLKLSHYRNELPKDKKDPQPDPYDLLREVEVPNSDGLFDSFVTESVKLLDEANRKLATIDLSSAVWSLDSDKPKNNEQITFSTVIRRGDEDVLRLSKTYMVLEDSRFHLGMSMDVQNLTSGPLNVIVNQRGPVGVKKEDYRYEYRKVVSAVMDADGVLQAGKKDLTIDKVAKGDTADRLLTIPDTTLEWVSLGNKYFACIVVPDGGQQEASSVKSVVTGGWAKRLLDDPTVMDDLSFTLAYKSPESLQSGQTMTLGFEAFCGPKSKALFDELPIAVERKYELIQSADTRWCTFEVITKVMLWLLTHLHNLVGNFGIAIIILVFIVRFVLHPITKKGQVNMMKMQKGMAQLKPKIDAIQQQYKNDKARLNEETMKLYREEGISPFGQMLGCLPMVLQMPIWIALWTMLNTNVDMRHQPFFWWIHDLSAPDSLIPFGTTYDVPLIGAMMGPIAAFNLLPIIMTITMYMQQKVTQKFSKPLTPAEPKLDKDGNPLPDTMAQQQKMMSIMMIFFGFIFYNFPSGLNLYILTSNILGILEQYHIKKQLREKEERGEFQVVKKKEAPRGGKAGFLQRLEKLAEDAKKEQSGRNEAAGKKKGKR